MHAARRRPRCRASADGHVGGLRVVHEQHAVARPPPPRAGAARRRTCAAPGAPRRGRSRGASAAAAAAIAFSRLWAPRRRSSPTSIRRHALPRELPRARPGRRPAPPKRTRPGARPADRRTRQGQSARSSSSWCAKMRSLAVAVAARSVPCRSRWSSSRSGAARYSGANAAGVLELEAGGLADHRRAPGRGCPRATTAACPTLPATATGTPAAREIAPSSSTVVVLPFVPVTATKRFGSRRQASSSSPTHREAALARRHDHRRLAAARPGSSPRSARALQQVEPVGAQLDLQALERARSGGLGVAADHLAVRRAACAPRPRPSARAPPPGTAPPAGSGRRAGSLT